MGSGIVQPGPWDWRRRTPSSEGWRRPTVTVRSTKAAANGLPCPNLPIGSLALSLGHPDPGGASPWNGKGRHELCPCCEQPRLGVSRGGSAQIISEKSGRGVGLPGRELSIPAEAGNRLSLAYPPTSEAGCPMLNARLPMGRLGHGKPFAAALVLRTVTVGRRLARDLRWVGAKPGTPTNHLGAPGRAGRPGTKCPNCREGGRSGRLDRPPCLVQCGSSADRSA
jgi:hypothetical protein